jgi:hypothetical protein
VTAITFSVLAWHTMNLLKNHDQLPRSEEKYMKLRTNHVDAQQLQTCKTLAKY